MRTGLIAVLLLVLGMSGSALADYIDARVDGVGANTFSDTNTYYAIPHVSGDGLWSERSNAAWGDGLVVNSSGEDSPLIYTVVDGLTVGAQYQVGVAFAGVGDWPIRAGLSAGALTLFTQDGRDILGEASTAGTLYIDQPTYDSYLGDLGVATADANGEIRVYVDDVPYEADGAHRVWYDGVNVDLIPEPATLGLMGLAGAVILSVRRRRVK